MKKQLLSLTILAQVLCAQDLQDIKKLEEPLIKVPQENIFSPTLDWIKTLEKDFKRDFYINQYLQTNISSKEAQEALDLASNVDIEMFLNFANKFEHDETKAVATCLLMDVNSLKDSYSDCIATGLTLKKANNLSSIDLDLIRQKIKDNYPILEKELKVISAAIPFTKLIVLKGEEIVNIYLNVDDEFRAKYFNYKLPKRTISKISENKENKIAFIEKTILSKDLKKVQNSLVNFNTNDLNFDETFLLAINALSLGKKDLTSKYLSLCLTKPSLAQENLDKIHFYRYLLLKNKQDLETILTSNSINIYSLLAFEMLKKSQNIKVDSNKFIRPYKELFKGLKTEEKAFFYALVKTKSDFNEKQLTKDSKLGAFALDIKDIKLLSKKLNIPFDISKQFFIEDNFKLAYELANEFKNEKTPLIKLLKMDKVNNISFNNEENSFIEKMILLEKELYKKDIYKEFVVNYYLYYELLKKKKEKSLKLSSIIFGSQVLLDHTLDEKALN